MLIFYTIPTCFILGKMYGFKPRNNYLLLYIAVQFVIFRFIKKKSRISSNQKNFDFNDSEINDTNFSYVYYSKI